MLTPVDKACISVTSWQLHLYTEAPQVPLWQLKLEIIILEQSLKILILYVWSSDRQQPDPSSEEHPWGIIATIGASLCKLHLDFPLSQQAPDVTAVTSTSADSSSCLIYYLHWWLGSLACYNITEVFTLWASLHMVSFTKWGLRTCEWISE